MSDTKCRIFLHDVHRVTEWRDGAIYRTERVGQVYATRANTPLRADSAILVVPSDK